MPRARTVTAWQTPDGQLFTSLEAASAHEREADIAERVHDFCKEYGEYSSMQMDASYGTYVVSEKEIMKNLEELRKILCGEFGDDVES